MSHSLIPHLHWQLPELQQHCAPVQASTTVSAAGVCLSTQSSNPVTKTPHPETLLKVHAAPQTPAGKHHFEKLVSGMFMGSVAGRILSTIAGKGAFFHPTFKAWLARTGSLPTANLAAIVDGEGSVASVLVGSVGCGMTAREEETVRGGWGGRHHTRQAFGRVARSLCRAAVCKATLPAAYHRSTLLKVVPGRGMGHSCLIPPKTGS